MLCLQYEIKEFHSTNLETLSLSLGAEAWVSACELVLITRGPDGRWLYGSSLSEVSTKRRQVVTLSQWPDVWSRFRPCWSGWPSHASRSWPSITGAGRSCSSNGNVWPWKLPGHGGWEAPFGKVVADEEAAQAIMRCAVAIGRFNASSGRTRSMGALARVNHTKASGRSKDVKPANALGPRRRARLFRTKAVYQKTYTFSPGPSSPSSSFRFLYTCFGATRPQVSTSLQAAAAPHSVPIVLFVRPPRCRPSFTRAFEN